MLLSSWYKKKSEKFLEKNMLEQATLNESHWIICICSVCSEYASLSFI